MLKRYNLITFLSLLVIIICFVTEINFEKTNTVITQNKAIELNGDPAINYANEYGINVSNDIEKILIYNGYTQYNEPKNFEFYFGTDYYIAVDSINESFVIPQECDNTFSFKNSTSSSESYNFHFIKNYLSFFSFDYDIDSSDLSAKLGYNRNSTCSFDTTITGSIPASTNYQFKIYIIYERKEYDIYKDSFGSKNFVCSGYSDKPVGVVAVISKD